MACFSNNDGCPKGTEFNYITMDGCMPCDEVILAGTDSGTTQNSGKKKIDIDKADYAQKGVGLFGAILNAFKKNKNQPSVDETYPDRRTPQPDTSMKYVWYIVGGILVLVAITIIFRLVKK